MHPYFHFLALCSGSGPSHFPLGEIQLTVRHSSQRNKLIVVVHACRYGPMTEMSLFTTLSCSELTSVCFSSAETWSRSPTTAQILTSASTCSLTNGGQAGGKLTPSRKTSTQFTTRRESHSPCWWCLLDMRRDRVVNTLSALSLCAWSGLSSPFPSWSSTGGLWMLRWRTAEVCSPNTKAFWERYRLQ